MKNHVVETITFHKGGNSAEFKTTGWSVAEESETWSDGGSASLNLPAPQAPFGYFLELEGRPFIVPPYLARQVFRVAVNGHTVRFVSRERAGTCAFFCPPPAANEERLSISFQFLTPDQPTRYGHKSDSRHLAFCFRRVRVIVLDEPRQPSQGPLMRGRISSIETETMKDEAATLTGVPIDTVFHRFEMVCGNCDLGLAQRALGFEKLSLLRFGGATVSSAIAGLETGFAGIGNDFSVSIADNPMQEWMVRDAMGLYFHTGQSSRTVDRSKLMQTFPQYVSVLRRKFLEDLDEGHKVFVFADHKDLCASRSVEDVLPLYLALRRVSTAALLWVVPSVNTEELKGSVRGILPGLAVGQLDLVQPPVLVGGGITVSGWLTVLCNAWAAFGLEAA